MKVIVKMFFVIMVTGVLSLFPSELRANEANQDTGNITRSGLSRGNPRQYLPILEVGKTWIYENYSLEGGEMVQTGQKTGMRVQGKSMEDGREVWDLAFIQIPDGEVLGRTWPAYEEEGILWWNFFGEHGGYAPVVDFNVEVGDYLEYEDFSPETWIFHENDFDYPDYVPHVIEKTFHEIGGVERCVVKIQKLSRLDYWIEGIGFTSEYILAPFVVETGTQMHMILSECWSDDKCIFNRSILDEWNGISKINDELPKDTYLYDLYGRKVDFPTKGSIYIRNGKKIVL